MRWKGIIFIIAILVIIFLLGYLFSDQWLENQFEDVGSAMVGALVEIDDLDISLTDLRLSWKRLQVTNPNNTMRNMVETGITEFDVEFLPLLSDKIIIEQIRINDIRTNTERQRDGRIETVPSSEQGFIGRTAMRLRKEAELTTSSTIGSFQRNVNVDSILKLLEIESIEKIENLRAELDADYTLWNSRIESFNFELEGRQLEERIRSINTANIKSIDGLQNALTQVNQINTSIDSMQRRISRAKSDLNTNLTKANTQLLSVDDWIAQDYQRALQKAQLPALNIENIGKMVFGKTVIDEFSQYLGYIGQARTYANKLDSGDPEDESPPRYEGQDIYFFNRNARPDFWIKEIDLSGETSSGIRLQGVIQHIVSDQRQIGKTTQLQIGGSDQSARRLKLNGELNYMQDMPQEHFNLHYSGFALDNTQISKSTLFPRKIKAGKGSVLADLKISGQKMGAQIRFNAADIDFTNDSKAEAQDELTRIMQGIIDGIRRIEIDARVSGEEDNIEFSLSSNLDNLLMQQLEGIAGAEVNKAKDRIKSEIDRRVDQHKSGIMNFVRNKEKELNERLAQYEQLAEEKIALADAKKKEIEKRIAKEKSKVTDQLKKLNPFK